MDEKAFRILALDVELLTRGLQDALTRITYLEEAVRSQDDILQNIMDATGTR